MTNYAESFDLSAHDQQQIELKQTLPLSNIGQSQPWFLDLYFFIPRNIGVSSINYPRDDFYADLNHFMRLDLPGMSLRELANDQDGPSPLVSLRRCLDRLAQGGKYDPFAQVAVKLFG